MKRVFIIVFVLVCFLIIGFNIKNSDIKKIEVGDTIPTFSLQDQNGKEMKIDHTIGKPMVIYFYPKDDTPGCTKEACKFRDEFESFTDLDALVIGISADSVASHKKFEEKYNLPFILLADIKNEVRKLFGVPKNLFLIPGRVTYVINEKGIVVYKFKSQLGAEKHIDKSLQKLKEITSY